MGLEIVAEAQSQNRCKLPQYFNERFNLKSRPSHRGRDPGSGTSLENIAGTVKGSPYRRDASLVESLSVQEDVGT